MDYDIYDDYNQGSSRGPHCRYPREFEDQRGDTRDGRSRYFEEARRPAPANFRGRHKSNRGARPYEKPRDLRSEYYGNCNKTRRPTNFRGGNTSSRGSRPIHTESEHFYGRPRDSYPETFDTSSESRRSPHRRFRGRSTPDYDSRPYQNDSYRKPEDSHSEYYDNFNESQSRSRDYRGRGATPNPRSRSGRPWPHKGARNLNHEFQDSDSSNFGRKRKFETRYNDDEQKRKFINTNGNEADEVNLNNKLMNEQIANKSSLIINEDINTNRNKADEVTVNQTFINREQIANKSTLIINEDNEDEAIVDKSTSALKETENTQEDTHVNDTSVSDFSCSDISQILEVTMELPSINKKIVKKITHNCMMQLKLFLLEVYRKLRNNFQVFYVSDLKSADKILDAMFCFEKANTRNLFQVKYYLQEFRSYKKLNYRTLMSADLNLDMIYKVFRDNEGVDRIIICSNLELDEQSLKKRNIKIIDNKSKGTRHLQVNEESIVFKKMIEKHSYLPKLAEYLDECLRTGKQVMLKGIMKECHTMLMTENVINIIGIDGRKQIGVLHPKFVNSPDSMLKPAIVQLRRHLKSLNFGELRINDKLVVSENFGKESSFQLSQPDILVHKLAIEDNIKKFFEKLEFMECEKNIDYHIHKELGEKFELIHSDFHIKVVKEELFARLKPGSDQSGLFRALERKILGCDLNNYTQQKNAMEIKLEFDVESLQNLKDVLQNNKSTIVINSDYPMLCDFKLRQVVKNLTKYSEGQYFFLDIHELLAAKDNLLAVFSTPLEHLLVVQTEGANLKNEQVNDCLKCIRQNISNDQNCTNTIVFIQKINDESLNTVFGVTEHKEMFNDKVGLTKACQDKLSETICECYGADGTTHAATLKELILEACDLTDLFTSAECVDKLVKGKVIIADSLAKPVIFESTYTVPRRLKRHVTLNSTILKEESKDTFFLFGEEKESKMSKVHYYKDLNSADTNFEQFSRVNKNLNAHLLKYVSNRGSNKIQLIWQKSSRSLNSLMKQTVENTEAARQSEPISDVLACRIMILCGKSGSGKSHYLFELAERLQTSNQNLEHWVVQLNLNDSLLEQYADSPVNSADEAVDLLTKILGYDELRQRLFRLSAFGKLKLKLSLFVDGLEKLRNRNARWCTQLLRVLESTSVSRIYVTTRPDFKKNLERALNDFAYNLDSLTRDEQKEFLTNTWFSLTNQALAQCGWNDYAEEIYNDNSLMDIIVEPLYLHIFALVFWSCVKAGQKIPTIQRICDVYKEYLDKFVNNLEGSRKEIFTKSFSYLSLKSLLHPDDFRKLNLPEVRDNEDFAKLNHSSFAEYGAAKWLASLPLKEQIAALNIMEDLSLRISTVFIETFACSCKKFYQEYIRQIGGNKLVVQLFINHIWDNADDYQKQEYLHEAVRMNRVKLVCEMMLRSAKINLPAEFLEQATVYVVTTLVKEKPKKSHPYWSLAGNLLKEVSQATTLIDADVQLPQFLAHFFARGRHDVVSKVFEALGDRDKEERILHTRVDNCTPLDIVNASASMSDDQRLEISKFLIERDNSKENAYAVMSAAAKHGHVRSFEYFAGKSTETRFNFFKDALKSNKIDVLRFLLSDSKWTRDCNKEKNQPLHTAVTEEVSLKTIDFLLRYGGVNNRNGNGETALCVAIKAGMDLRIIKFLIQNEADVNAKDKLGLRAWCYAVLRKWCCYTPRQQLELMRFLKNENCNLRLPHPDDHQLSNWIKEIQRKLEYLWDPESFDLNYHKRSPRLHTALLEKDVNWFKFLLQHGADPDAVDSQKRTALHLAVRLGKGCDILDSVRLLLRHGATFNAVDLNGKTPLDLLRSSDNAANEEDRAYKLLRHAKDLFIDKNCIEQLKEDLSVQDSKAAQSTNLYWLIHCRDSHGRTLLHRAAERSVLLEQLEKLMHFTDYYGDKRFNHRSWLDLRDNYGETVVHKVARFGNPKILRELARKGASLNTKNCRGVIPLSNDHESKEFLKIANQLFSAVQRGSLVTLQGVSKNTYTDLAKARDEIGRSLLHLAASGQSSTTHFLLCKWKANVNAVDHEGRTPLHYALKKDDFDSAKLLLKAGAIIDARDKNGKQPGDLENQGFKSVEMVNSLNEILEQCWRAKLSVTELDAKVETVKRKFDMEPSVVVNVRDNDGNSMVHYAVRNHEPELLKALLKYGAMYNTRNSSKKTPMDLAVGEIKELLDAVDDLFKCPKIASWEDKKDVVDVEIMTKCRKEDGCTLLHASLEDKKIEEARWLMGKGADVNVTNCEGAAARKLAEGLQIIVV